MDRDERLRKALLPMASNIPSQSSDTCDRCPSDDYQHRPTTDAHNVFARPIGAEAMISGQDATLARIMTTAEVAQFLRVHQSTLYKLVRKGLIPAFKIGTDYRFYRDEIEKWMTDRQLNADPNLSRLVPLGPASSQAK
jgi:excisionase family DNA binding protein